MKTALKVRKCAQCRQPFMQQRLMQKLCSLPCAIQDAEAHMARRLAKVKRDEKKADRARKEQAKTKPELTKEAQKEFNAYIRERDKDQPCISCGAYLRLEAVGGGYDCGHYRSVGSAAHLRFDERNAHGQCKQCNRWGAGRAVDYRIGLVARIGLEAVEALESDSEPHKWTRDELRHKRDHYRALTKQLKKEAKA